MALEPPKSPITRELSPFGLYGSSSQSSFLRTCLYLPRLRACDLAAAAAAAAELAVYKVSIPRVFVEKYHRELTL